jgi:S1-C subfamily serine protease
MRKTILLCGLCVLAGVVIANTARDVTPTRLVVAQDLPATTQLQDPKPLRPSSGQVTARLPSEEFTPEERVNIAVYDAVYRSVVNINTRGIQYVNSFYSNVPAESEGLGSGIVLDNTGHILTNEHVVESAQQIEVTLVSGKRYQARLVGEDPVNDIAVLKIDAPAAELVPATLGESTPLRVGQRIYVIGSPFELERTFTTGIISSLNRTLPSGDRRRVMKSIIQVDAAMNPGNSGGPLLDTHGRVIGMSTAIASTTGESAGVGFAIPVDRIKRVVPELIQHGKITRPDIGIDTVVLTENGLLIRTLVPGGPAERAGLRGFRVVRQRRRQGNLIFERTTEDLSSADVITAVDGHPTRSLDDFLSRVEAKKPGEEVVLTILRQGQQIKLPVRLEASD